MGIKKIWLITYVDRFCELDGIADILVEGYDENEALENFSLITDSAAEIISVEEIEE